MKEIKDLVSDIQDEVAGAEHYAKQATKYKEKDKVLAETYAKKAQEELVHVNDFHAQVVRLINAQKATSEKPPAGMQEIWDWEHGKIVDNVARVRTILEMYKTS